ncbi:hypothetical protein NP493_1029g04008 [Ridgeia piscesae]|uniref:Uncharacterized protein n=1 Tax=Ridgeia piscesae TaxID=27915 RepID=A0AAD9KJA9_RIDPI|nr:hypothetical protein NP493_1029g04008 [Ridgeia piscesae]
MGSSAAGSIQHSQDISWQARQKAPGLVRPQRPGATDSYEQKRSSTPESCKPGALDPPLQHIKMPADCYKNTKQHEGFLQWTERSVGIQKEGTCSHEINRWNGDLL